MDIALLGRDQREKYTLNFIKHTLWALEHSYPRALVQANSLCQAKWLINTHSQYEQFHEIAFIDIPTSFNDECSVAVTVNANGQVLEMSQKYLAIWITIELIVGLSTTMPNYGEIFMSYFI